MVIMQVNNLDKSYGATNILTQIKLDIKSKDRIAIVGRNGCGKSTLLKILAGELSYDQGEIIKRRETTIGYLSQHTSLESELTIWEEMLTVFDSLIAMGEDLRGLEESMQNTDNVDDDLLRQYDNLLEEFQSKGGYEYESKIRAVLSGLDFPEDYYDRNIQSLSGGQKTRLALGKLLLENPNLLILDEPTNHLDIETLSWLESYLSSYDGAILMVSHDRYFLENTVSIIYEIAFRRMKRYVGGYQKFLEQRQGDYERQLKLYEHQQEEIKQAEEFIERNIARASTSKRAQSRRKQLEKLERVEKPIGGEGSAKFSFEINRRSGNDVLRVKDLSFAYEKDQALFSNLSFGINRKERIALIGPNGIGKTTLLKLLMKQLKATRGTITHGSNVEVAYYDQEQDLLTPSNNVLEELWGDYPQVNERDIRTVLGNFLFSGEDVLKLVASLSGGEKARLSLAKLMMKQANLLILDEPTNHLDIDSKEVLEEALIDYPGTIIFVSHDRYFINKIADQVIELDRNKATVYLGDYDYYMMKKEEERERSLLQRQRSEKQEQVTEDRKTSFEERKERQREERRRQRRIEEIESQIADLEGQLEEIELQQADPEIFEDYEKTLELSKEADALREKINSFMEEWAELHE